MFIFQNSAFHRDHVNAVMYCRNRFDAPDFISVEPSPDFEPTSEDEWTELEDIPIYKDEDEDRFSAVVQSLDGIKESELYDTLLFWREAMSRFGEDYRAFDSWEDLGQFLYEWNNPHTFVTLSDEEAIRYAHEHWSDWFERCMELVTEEVITGGHKLK